MSNDRGRGISGKKRNYSQPMEGASKDSRVDDDLSWSTVVQGKKSSPITTSNSFGLLAEPDSYPDRTMRSGSISSRGSRGNRGNRGIPSTSIGRNQQQSRIQSNRREDRPADLGDNTRFVTPAQNGPFRDEIVVECQKINDRPFKGTITFTEATDSIFMAIMGFNFNDLYSVRMRFSGCPTIRYKLKEQTNIDDLINVEHFNLERRSQNPNETDYISCKILGIRGMTSVPHYDGSENDVRWIKIEGSEYLLTEDELKQGLAPFGELLTPIREDIHDDSDSERGAVGNGINSVKMKLAKPIPQFLPMHGRRIRIYYSGVEKICTNCYGKHTRRQCRNHKKPWIEYVRDFMYDNKEIGEDYYGKWWDIIDTEYPGYFDGDGDETVENNEGRQEYSQQAGFDDRPQQERHHQPQQPPQLQSREGQQEYPQQSVTADRSISRQQQQPQQLPQLQSRDPRLNKQQPRPTENRPYRMQQTNSATGYDRQKEMTGLLACGLTLTDAKRYLDNKEEQMAIEQRMRHTNSAPRGRQHSRGSSLNRM